MKKYFVALVLLISTQVHAQTVEIIRLQNHFRLFSQKTGPEFSFPVPITDMQNVSIDFEIPVNGEPTIKKVYNQVFISGDFKTVFEIYFFNQNNERYLSQQITLSSQDKIIVKCTSYFSTQQKMLVPGACAGEQGGLLYGISVFRGLF